MQIIVFCPFIGEIVCPICLPLKSAFSFSCFSILAKVMGIRRTEFLLVCSHMMSFSWWLSSERTQFSQKRSVCQPSTFQMSCIVWQKQVLSVITRTHLHRKQCRFIPSTKYLHMKSRHTIFAVAVLRFLLASSLREPLAGVLWACPSFSLRVNVVVCECSWRESKDFNTQKNLAGPQQRNVTHFIQLYSSGKSWKGG